MIGIFDITDIPRFILSNVNRNLRKVVKVVFIPSLIKNYK
jgi:hypothetical protein